MIRQYNKLKQKREDRLKDRPLRRQKPYSKAICKVFCSAMLLICLFAGIVLLFSLWLERREYIPIIFGMEVWIFIFSSFCKATIGKKRKLFKKLFYGIRIFFVFFVVYAVLAGVYFSGSMENYSDGGIQSLQLVNDSDVNFYTMKSEEKIDSQLVLFETDDYYYVTDVTVRGGSTLGVSIWNNDTYRFIDKTECPVKTVGGYLNYIGGNSRVSSANDMWLLTYIAAILILGVTFICLLNVPKKEEVLPQADQEDPENP